MTREDIQSFSMRIAAGNRTELTVITYDIIITYLNTAVKEYENKNTDEFVFNIKKARQFVNQLSSSLNMDYKVSYDLLSLYLYANRTLLKCAIRKEPINVDNIINIMERLRDSFAEVAKYDTSGAMMENTQQVYAGYTYGRNGLNVTVQ